MATKDDSDDEIPKKKLKTLDEVKKQEETRKIITERKHYIHDYSLAGKTESRLL